MKALLLFLLCSAASAQTMYVYTGGLFGTQTNPFDIPQLSGSIILDAPLAANLKDQTVTPLSYNFGYWMSSGVASFAFSTDQNGTITDWSMNIEASIGGGPTSGYENAVSSSAGDSYYAGIVSTLCDRPPGVTASGCVPTAQHASAGNWVDPPIAAPEIDPKGWIIPFLILAGGLAVLRGRKA